MPHFNLSGFSFTNIHDSWDSRRRGKLSLLFLSTIFASFTGAETLAGILLQGVYLYAWLAVGPELETFGLRVPVAHDSATGSHMLGLKV